MKKHKGFDEINTGGKQIPVKTSRYCPPPESPEVEILFKVFGNFFKYVSMDKEKVGEYYSYGRSQVVYAIGSWFRCSEEEINRIRAAVWAGKAEAMKKIPGCLKRYKLPELGE